MNEYLNKIKEIINNLKQYENTLKSVKKYYENFFESEQTKINQLNNILELFNDKSISIVYKTYEEQHENLNQFDLDEINQVNSLFERNKFFENIYIYNKKNLNESKKILEITKNEYEQIVSFLSNKKNNNNNENNNNENNNSNIN